MRLLLVALFLAPIILALLAPYNPTPVVRRPTTPRPTPRRTTPTDVYRTDHEPEAALRHAQLRDALRQSQRSV